MARNTRNSGTLGLWPCSCIRKVSEIAYGQQRLLEIALALALKPKVLLLDEPAAGVPQSDTGRIETGACRLPADLAVLMIEHDMDLVFRFAKRVIVLAAGDDHIRRLASRRHQGCAACAKPISGAMPMPAAPLEIEDLCAGYGPTRVLENVSLSAAGRIAPCRSRPQRHGQDDAARNPCRPDRRYEGTIRLDDVDFTAYGKRSARLGRSWLRAAERAASSLR